jgi:nitrogenase-stabilizing/protective protein
MSVFDELRKLHSAEDFFESLGVDYDPAVVRVARLHILRRMAEYLSKNDFDGLGDDDVRAACKETLAKSYEDFVSSSPIAERVFKVHKDAIKPKQEPAKPFISLTTLTGAGG